MGISICFEGTIFYHIDLLGMHSVHRIKEILTPRKEGSETFFKVKG